MSARRLRSIAGGAAGNVLEWFDFLAYSVFAIYLSRAFFPSENTTTQLLNAAAIAAVGYVARPLGSWLIGVLADRRGRRAALSLAVALMSVGSFVIALTPGYASIGVAAPVILLLARLLQGFSMGGEAGTSATYLAEMAPPGRHGGARARRGAAVRDRELGDGRHDRMGGAAAKAGRARELVLLVCQRLRRRVGSRLHRDAGDAAALDTVRRGPGAARRARRRHPRGGLAPSTSGLTTLIGAPAA